jgi:glyoxylase-like metal-dependent hydrolase (beta-lactamase superfamily II)
MPLNRREFFAVASGAFASIPAARLLARAQQPVTPPPATAFADVRRGVGTFTGQGGTIGWLRNKDAIIVVDTQYPRTATICLEGIKQQAGRAPDLVFNTHHHIDHTGGNGVFRPEIKKLIAQANVPGLQKRVAAETPNAEAAVVADATFDKTWTEHAGDETLAARYYGPGHTSGDAILRFEKADVVHMGDLLWLELHPRVDRSAGASIANWIKTLETVSKEMPRNTIYIAGHTRRGIAVTTDRSALIDLRNYFDAAMTFTRKAMADGRTRESLASETTLPGFEKFQAAGTTLTLGGVLQMAYDELTSGA